ALGIVHQAGPTLAEHLPEAGGADRVDDAEAVAALEGGGAGGRRGFRFRPAGTALRDRPAAAPAAEHAAAGVAAGTADPATAGTAAEEAAAEPVEETA